MDNARELLHQLTEETRGQFKQQQMIMSFGEFLEKLIEHPLALTRNASQYLHDTFAYYGPSQEQTANHHVRWQIFDEGTEKHVPIIGAESVQDEIYKALSAFNRQGHANKLILLHGPNGSAKSSIVESLAYAMHRYSQTDEGAVYRFNWIFPTEKSHTTKAMGASAPIGFGSDQDLDRLKTDTFAFLEESKIASKIHSEFRENPIFLIPLPTRQIWLKKWISMASNCNPEDAELPVHVTLPGLSKRNQLIFENLLSAYDGDIAKVLSHVQVERFYYSRQYRVGVGTVEPQMSIDAIERQLTMDRNIGNLPPILHNISFHEASGPLVEANRGILEFSDMLKRPIEAFKYLLSTVEKGTLNLPSSTANLDIVFFATTNEKHLDAFKTIPDFASFRSRFELVTAPYLLRPSLEEKIYKNDVRAISEAKPVAPHTLRLLCLWAVLTRLKQPNPEYYEAKSRSLIARLDPTNKIKVYEDAFGQSEFKPADIALFKELRGRIMEEYQNVVAYEGRFGASPREIRSILYRAAQHPNFPTLTPMAIFDELERLVKDRTVYEFLQLEPRGKYHQPSDFIQVMKKDFAKTFEHEASQAMTLVEDTQYDALLKRYVEGVVAKVKGEKIYNKATSSYEPASESMLEDVEKILSISGPIERHRESILGRIAAYKIDNPDKSIVVGEVFGDYLKTLRDHYYQESKKIIDRNFEVMLAIKSDVDGKFSQKEIELAELTYKNLNERFGYDELSAVESLKFLISFKAAKSS